MAGIPKPYVPTSRAHPSAGMEAEKSAPLEYSPSGGEGRAQQDLALAQRDYPDATMYQMPGDTEYVYGFRTLPDGTVEDIVVDKMGKRLNLAANPAALEAVRKQRLQRPDIGGEPSSAVMDPKYRDVALESGETLEGARVTSTPEGLLTATGDAPARTIPYEELGTQDEPWPQAVPGGDVDPDLEAFDRFGSLGPESSPADYDFVRQLAASKAFEEARSRPFLRDPREGMSRSQLEDLNPARSRRDRERMLRSGTGQGGEGKDPMKLPFSGSGRSLAELRGEDVLSPRAKAEGTTLADKEEWREDRRQGVVGRHKGRMEEAQAERKARSSKKES
jgi:hypothetical protein